MLGGVVQVVNSNPERVYNNFVSAFTVKVNIQTLSLSFYHSLSPRKKKKTIIKEADGDGATVKAVEYLKR